MIDAGDPFALASEGLHDIAPIIPPVETDGRQWLVVHHKRRIGHHPTVLAAHRNRGDLAAGVIEHLVELALRHVPQSGGYRQQRAGCQIVDLFEINELFEVVQRLMRGDSDRPAVGGRRLRSGKLERRAEIGQRRIAFIQRCPHAGQQHARCVFPRIGRHGLERVLLGLGEVAQLEVHVRQGHEDGHRGLSLHQISQGVGRFAVAATGDAALDALRHGGLRTDHGCNS